MRGDTISQDIYQGVIVIYTGGFPYQGYSVGVMKFEGKLYPLLPGDVANATTYPFPVLIREIPNVSNNPYPPLTTKDGSYTQVVQDCISAAQQLEKDGVRSIAMCCGFFSLIQPIISAEVNIPILTSPIVMIPVIHQMLKPDQSVIVVTASKNLLSKEFFSSVGVDLNDRVIVAGLDHSKAYKSICMGGTGITLESDDLKDDVLAVIREAQDPNVGAILLECTSLPPFAADVYETFKLPVFDFIGCIEWMHRAVVPKSYSGYI
jgi:aspartate/glutamate racemase